MWPAHQALAAHGSAAAAVSTNFMTWWAWLQQALNHEYDTLESRASH